MSDEIRDQVRAALDSARAAAVADARRRQAEHLVARLQDDEVAMLRHITAGWSSTDSAASLNLDPYQFEKRRASLLAKLNAGSTSDAVRVGIYAGLD